MVYETQDMKTIKSKGEYFKNNKGASVNKK